MSSSSSRVWRSTRCLQLLNKSRVGAKTWSRGYHTRLLSRYDSTDIAPPRELELVVPGSFNGLRSYHCERGILENGYTLQLPGGRNLTLSPKGTGSDAVRHFSVSMSSRQIGGRKSMNIFDREAKRKQKNRAAIAEDAAMYDYLRDEVASHVVDRVSDVSRFFPVALDVGCGHGHVARLMSDEIIGALYQSDMADRVLLTSSSVPGDVPTHRVVADEEFLPFADNTFNLAVSSLSLHWVNDLPKALSEIARVLKPDAPLVGAIFAGDTLFELRGSLQLAELEREGGFAPHVSPFVQLRDLGGLLNSAGYSLTTIDVDEIQVNYPSMFELMQDLRGMGENNCAWNRPAHIRRSTLSAAAAIYKTMYGRDGERGVPATFQILYFIGWKPDKAQAQPAKRGSATASLKDLSSSLADKLDT